MAIQSDRPNQKSSDVESRHRCTKDLLPKDYT